MTIPNEHYIALSDALDADEMFGKFPATFMGTAMDLGYKTTLGSHIRPDHGGPVWEFELFAHVNDPHPMDKFFARYWVAVTADDPLTAAKAALNGLTYLAGKQEDVVGVFTVGREQTEGKLVDLHHHLEQSLLRRKEQEFDRA